MMTEKQNSHKVGFEPEGGWEPCVEQQVIFCQSCKSKSLTEWGIFLVMMSTSVVILIRAVNYKDFFKNPANFQHTPIFPCNWSVWGLKLLNKQDM